MDPVRRSGPPRSEAARMAILEATARRFAEAGYEGLTIEGVAAEAHVGKQTIYRWWPSRSALVADCLAEGLLMPDWSVPADSGDIRADLARWLGDLTAFLAEPGNEALLRSLVVVAAQDADVATRLSERLGVLALLGARLQAAVAAGEIGAVPVEDVIDAMLGAVVVRVLRRREIDAGFAQRLVASLLGSTLLYDE